jgi:carbohydrate kinase (thermoresistant glucokinase family)
MGVTGAGKTTVARAMSVALGVPYIDADDLHPPSNVEKMAAGVPLDDNDRWPWLRLVGSEAADGTDGVVIACSAIKRRYRNALRVGTPSLIFVHLAPPWKYWNSGLRCERITSCRQVCSIRNWSRLSRLSPMNLVSRSKRPNP